MNAGLDRLCAELAAAAGSNLSAVVLYGGAARGRYRPGRSDVNLLILLGVADEPALRAVAPALGRARRAIGVAPMILASGELRAAADAFPTKLLDIQGHHVVLTGADPFGGLEVSWERARMRIAQELRNLLLRQRAFFVACEGAPGDVDRALRQLTRPLAVELAGLLSLAGRPALEEDRTAAIFADAAQAFRLDGEALALLAEAREEGGRFREELAPLFPRVLDTLGRAADAADALKEVGP